MTRDLGRQRVLLPQLDLQGRQLSRFHLLRDLHIARTTLDSRMTIRH